MLLLYCILCTNAELVSYYLVCFHGITDVIKDLFIRQSVTIIVPFIVHNHGWTRTWLEHKTTLHFTIEFPQIGYMYEVCMGYGVSRTWEKVPIESAILEEFCFLERIKLMISSLVNVCLHTERWWILVHRLKLELHSKEGRNNWGRESIWKVNKYSEYWSGTAGSCQSKCGSLIVGGPRWDAVLPGSVQWRNSNEGIVLPKNYLKSNPCPYSKNWRILK